MSDANAFLIYQDDNGVSNVNVRFEGEDVWLAAEQLQQLFQASQQDVNHDIQQIYADGELLAEATDKKYLLVRNEWNRLVKCNILQMVRLRELLLSPEDTLILQLTVHGLDLPNASVSAREFCQARR